MKSLQLFFTTIKFLAYTSLTIFFLRFADNNHWFQNGLNFDSGSNLKYQTKYLGNLNKPKQLGSSFYIHTGGSKKRAIYTIFKGLSNKRSGK